MWSKLSAFSIAAGCLTNYCNILASSAIFLFNSKVIASNGEEEAEATVQIKIEDVNEYAPKFDSLLYDVEVPENIEPGHMIVHVHAFDRDISEQDRLTYKIQQGSPLNTSI